MGIWSVSHLYNLYRITVETTLPKENFCHKKGGKLVSVCHRYLVQFTLFLVLLFFFNFFGAITLWEDVAAANTWSIFYHVD